MFTQDIDPSSQPKVGIRVGQHRTWLLFHFSAPSSPRSNLTNQLIREARKASTMGYEP